MQINHLSKQLNNRELFSDITFNVNPGEIIGIVGRNGIGKTSLFRTIMGLYTPDQGEVLIHGKSLAQHPELKEQLFLLPDEFKAWEGYKLKTIQKFYSKNYTHFNDEKFTDLMLAFNLPINAKLGTYSKGMSALFGIILSLSIGAQYLLLDEPMEGLDIIVQKKIMSALMAEVSDRQLGIVLSSHRLDDLAPIADYVHLIKNKKIEKTYHLESLRSEATKIQIAFKDGIIPDFVREQGDIINKQGQVFTILFMQKYTDLHKNLLEIEPLFMDQLPVTLTDLFNFHLKDEED
ncbi:ABC transporter ATP-binding protein [Brochothrix thermosphacta]|mgnify:FL=1|uniref:ABC transporter ATP-binding protein n=2 Tax=Brochothrix TaxID=2755 RepID=A0A1D2K9G5_BROTH|nr:ABC transporter ATP-binding protein [Brochothrix thermosphacta]SLN04002.1 ABC transporter, ATP-binding protein [Brachybacterium faecium]ATF25731.1 ABC transporter ATP-binding protein [Brochothrix thermosphacta]MPQ29473.1 ABC transporter ATP-binding protein [Brochothrix thermosphacta]ODJ51878.1 ABC transporter ATP-binding protein [Brochothrix thermosphacta DSM 20171 = FSL F6-1036]ODJ52233.1 ABC transporter ATP-binding protein [Brochothrix thermosphacta]